MVTPQFIKGNGYEARHIFYVFIVFGLDTAQPGNRFGKMLEQLTNRNNPVKYRKIPIISLYLFKRLFCWAYFRGSVFSEGLVIGMNFAFQNGLADH